MELSLPTPCRGYKRRYLRAQHVHRSISAHLRSPAWLASLASTCRALSTLPERLRVRSYRGKVWTIGAEMFYSDLECDPSPSGATLTVHQRCNEEGYPRIRPRNDIDHGPAKLNRLFLHFFLLFFFTFPPQRHPRLRECREILLAHPRVHSRSKEDLLELPVESTVACQLAKIASGKLRNQDDRGQRDTEEPVRPVCRLDKVP
ncbi:uncharacterized protein LOC143218218 [Lasioglossum baleicum]|uniref:uncharacterized protein LOC143218218 n=1 Tax=Lasioglossum baleicum TaxID=434251 RepID=UPI003FCD9792